MSMYDYESAFGAWDKTSRPMRRAIDEWFSLYFCSEKTPDRDPSQRIAYTVVSKLIRTVFGEYKVFGIPEGCAKTVQALNACAQQALQLALIGGECYIKPCPEKDGFSFTLVNRRNILIFGRDARGRPVDVGTAEHSVLGRFYYTLLERRRVDDLGYLTIENKLYRSLSDQTIGTRVPLKDHPDYEALADVYCYPKPVGSVGLVQVRTPMLNCVDGSADGVSVYAAAAGLIDSIDRNEAQLNGEFSRGESRILVSSDLLRNGTELEDHIFVGLDEEPEQVGITVFAPQLREQSYLARKQEYLRNVESVIGLKRGMLSDANAEDRTATEISSSAGDYSLTVIDFQRMWEKALGETLQLCSLLAPMYALKWDVPEQNPGIEWGNGVLYDEDKLWQDYRQMVSEGLLKPEIALGWRFHMPAETLQQQAAVREKLMPEN